MGTNFFKVISTFTTESNMPLTVGIGVAYVKNPEILKDKQKGLLSIWESYMPQNGNLGTTIVVKPTEIEDFASHGKEQFVLIKAISGKPITYYVGAGWNKAPQFKTKQDWLDYVNLEILKMKF